MAAEACLVLYGNSVFLAGIKAELERDPALELITVEVGHPDVMELIGRRKPQAVLVDLAAEPPGLAVTLLREQPGLLLIGVDPSCDELLVLSGRPQRALSVADLVDVIHQERRG